MAMKLTESNISYNDLISTEDRDFWNYLTRKDFRRVEKLITQEMGKGNFTDDTSDSDSQDAIPNKSPSPLLRRKGDDYDEDDDPEKDNDDVF